MQKIYTSAAILVLFLVNSQSAWAQQVNKKALEKATFYTAPREFQIIDDRPVVKDFREGPQSAGTVDLGGGPPGSGSGSGAGSGAGGGNSTIPAGGLHMGPAGVRVQSNSLPQSSFGSNIPARGLAPAGMLPAAGSHIYGAPSAPAHANPLASARSSANSSSNSSMSRSAATGPVTRSYSGGYSSTPPSAGSPSSTQVLKVRGKLLNSK